MSLAEEIKRCRFCAPAFAATKTAHVPRPVVWFQPEARILIAGQAPGLRVHKSGRPFTDPSGERLRRWMGINEETFYDRARIAIVPMAFCFPGYSAKGADLPPPKGCAQKWRARVMAGLGNVETTLLVGGAAQSWHIGPGSVTARVAAWRDFAPRVFPLPHPSWRNNHWLAKHPWFEADLIPALQARMKDML